MIVYVGQNGVEIKIEICGVFFGCFRDFFKHLLILIAISSNFEPNNFDATSR